MEYKYIVNNNNRIIIRDELILSNQQILQAINFCNQALQKLDQETKQFDINIFEILGMRNLSGMVGEYFCEKCSAFFRRTFTFKSASGWLSGSVAD